MECDHTVANEEGAVGRPQVYELVDGRLVGRDPTEQEMNDQGWYREGDPETLETALETLRKTHAVLDMAAVPKFKGNKDKPEPLDVVDRLKLVTPTYIENKKTVEGCHNALDRVGAPRCTPDEDQKVRSLYQRLCWYMDHKDDMGEQARQMHNKFNELAVVETHQSGHPKLSLVGRFNAFTDAQRSKLASAVHAEQKRFEELAEINKELNNARVPLTLTSGESDDAIARTATTLERVQTLIARFKRTEQAEKHANGAIHNLMDEANVPTTVTEHGKERPASAPDRVKIVLSTYQPFECPKHLEQLAPAVIRQLLDWFGAADDMGQDHTFTVTLRFKTPTRAVVQLKKYSVEGSMLDDFEGDRPDRWVWMTGSGAKE